MIVFGLQFVELRTLDRLSLIELSDFLLMLARSVSKLNFMSFAGAGKQLAQAGWCRDQRHTRWLSGFKFGGSTKRLEDS